MRLIPCSSFAAASFLLLACTEPHRSLSISVDHLTATVNRGTSVTINVTIARSSLSGDVALSATGLPIGVTASFAPSTLTGSATSSVLTISASATAVIGAATLSLAATGGGVSAVPLALPLTVTVAGNYALAASPAALSLEQGLDSIVAITVTPSGGFTGTVSLVFSASSPGVTGTLSSSATSGTAVTLTMAASATLAPGTYSITITGSTPGLADVTATMPVTISAPHTQPVSVAFCSEHAPVWFAYQNQNGGWNVATPGADGSYTFTGTDRVSIAFVANYQTGTFSTSSKATIIEATVAELTPAFAPGLLVCHATVGTKHLSGSIGGLTDSAAAKPTFPGNPGVTTTLASPGFAFTTLPDGPLDLLVQRFPSFSTSTPTQRMIVRRGVNLTSGSSIPAIDISGPESFVPQQAQLTMTGFAAGDVLNTNGSFATAGGATGQMFFNSTAGTSSLVTVPSAQPATGDIQWATVVAGLSSGTEGRTTTAYFTDPASLTLAVGPMLGTPAATAVATTPYVRLHGQVPRQPQYTAVTRFDMTQSPKIVTMFVTSAFRRPSPTWDVTVPDFTGLSGFDPSWMLVKGVSTAVRVEAFEASPALVLGATPSAGNRSTSASQLIFVTP